MIIKKNGDQYGQSGHSRSRSRSGGPRDGARGRAAMMGAAGGPPYTPEYFTLSSDSEDEDDSFMGYVDRLSDLTLSDGHPTPKLDTLVLPLDRGVQKQIIGQVLYPTVQVLLRTRTTHSAYARKITGILMELSIVTLLEHQRNLPLLESRVNEEFDNLQIRGFDPNGPEATQSPVFRE